MNFARDPSEEALEKQFRERMKAQLRGAQRRESFCREEWTMCGNLGLLGMCVPEIYGGQGLGARMSSRVFRILGESCRDLGLGFSVGAHALGCARPILEFGSERLHAALLPPLVSGESVGALAMTEPNAGSDIGAIESRAVRNGGHYLLNGEKVYVTNAPVAGVFVIFAMTEPRAGVLGISAFAVERASSGIEVTEAAGKIGLESSPMGAIRFHDCPVPIENRLGGEGQGREIFTRAMEWERTCISGLFLGMLDRQLSEVIEHARTRRQFGRAIGRHQAVAHRIANMYLRRASVELLVEQAGWRLDQGVDNGLDSSAAKLALVDAAIQSSLDAVHIFGAAGVLADRGIEAYLRDAVMSPMFAGTPEILRDRIAAQLLG